MKRIMVLGAMVGTVLSGVVAFADANENFPSSMGNSALYYQIGGGRSVPVPAVANDVSIPIDAEGDVGLGFSCGMFNPVNTITNSLNDFQDSVQNVSASIVANATSAIMSFPMYKLAQADPKLYNILNNNIIGAHDQFALQMKSCDEMQSEASKGQDPYNNWIAVSRNNNMKSTMAFGDGDLNKAMSKVNQQQGNNGVPWATPGAPLGTAAGGVGQPPIMVVHDTVIAGYNVMLGRNPTDTEAPGSSPNNQTLLNYWATPQQAAEWVVSVVGDQTVTTCTEVSCAKSAAAGQGLLPYVQSASTTIATNLANLVANPDQETEANLLAVSAPGQVVSPALIQNIREMNPNAQGNTVATLAQDIATTRVVNEALLAINIVQQGAQVPNIQASGPAQQVLHNKLKLLQDDISQIMYSVSIRRQLASNVMADIMRYNQAQEAQAASLPEVGNQTAVLQNGGIVNQDQ